MSKLNKEKGLIKYASLETIKDKTSFKLSKRAYAYSLVLLFVLFSIVISLINRPNFETTVLRTRGTLFQNTKDERLSNIYDISLINKTNNDYKINIKTLNGVGHVQVIGDTILVKGGCREESKLMILMKKEDLLKYNTELVLEIYGDSVLIDKVKTTFIAPNI